MNVQNPHRSYHAHLRQPELGASVPAPEPTSGDPVDPGGNNGGYTNSPNPPAPAPASRLISGPRPGRGLDLARLVEANMSGP